MNSRHLDVRGSGRNALRILHLIPSLAGGGAEKQLACLAAAQVEAGMEVHVGFIHSGPNRRTLESSGARLHEIAAVANHDPFIGVRLFALLAKLRPAICQTWLLQMDVLGGLAALLSGTKWVLSERSSARMYVRGFKNRIRHALGRRADAVVANSSAGLEYWSRVRPGRVNCVIRNIVASSDGRPDKNLSLVQGADGDLERTVIVAGRMSEEKNLVALFEALRMVLEARSNVCIEVFGDGPLREQLEAYADNAAIRKRVTFHGYSDQLHHCYDRASLLVSVSHYEGTPNAVVEAAIRGCPLVVSDIEEHREILSQETAVFVDRHSPEAIARGVMGVLDDPAAARERAEAAKGLFADWNAPAIEAAYRDLYARVLRA